MTTAPQDVAPHDLDPAILSPLAAIDDYLGKIVEYTEFPPNLKNAIKYSLCGGGKRLRPLLAWWACCAVRMDTQSDTARHGGPGAYALPAAAAVELVHAFSLVHDDLPAMDDDDMRRGRPTLHKASNEAMAILAGDAMLNLAYSNLAACITHQPLLCELVKELALGTSGMIAGQVYDTLGEHEFEGSKAFMGDHWNPEVKLVTIHINKTGALLRAACRMGALSGAGVPPTLEEDDDPESGGTLHRTVVDAITEYGESIGLMFQIIDDIIDATQPAEHAGKRTGKDIEAGKLTYPGVIGLEKSRRRVQDQLDAALEALKPLGKHGEPLAAIAKYLAVRTK